MKRTAWGATSLAVVLVYALLGVTMLIWPTFLLKFANYILATILCLIAVGMIVHYFRASALAGVQSISLGLGLLLLLIGGVLFFKPNILTNLLPFVWGLALVVGGFGKVQMSMDLKRIGDRGWWTIMIGVVISLALGVLCVFKPGTIATVLTMFIGISLLVEATLDLYAILLMRKRIGKAFPDGAGDIR